MLNKSNNKPVHRRTDKTRSSSHTQKHSHRADLKTQRSHQSRATSSPVRQSATKRHPGKAARTSAQRSRHEKHTLSPRAASLPIEQNQEKVEGSAHPLLTRRNVIFGAAGAALVAAGAGAYALTRSRSSNKSSNPSTTVGDMSVLNVPADAVFTTEDCTFVENNANVISLRTSCTLPFGTLIWAADDQIAACLLPTQTSSPLAKVGLIPLSSGTLRTVLNQAEGHDEGFEIYDVRANSFGIIWLESNIMDGTWRVYTSPLDGAELLNITLTFESDAKWNMPSLAVSGEFTYWQTSSVSTDASIPAKGKLYRARFGSTPDAIEEVCSTKTALACAPTATPEGIVAAERLDVAGTYYQMTVYDAEAQVRDKLILPATVKPSEVAYGPDGFSFCLEGIYNSNSGIANLGTYACASAIPHEYRQVLDETLASMEEPEKEGADKKVLTDADVTKAQSYAEQNIADLYSTASWFRFPRSPLTDPAWCDGWFLVKSTNVVAGIDMANRRYFTIEPENATQSYGEFLASSSTSGRFVTYANLDYTPMNGTPVQECRMRVWETV